MLWTWESLALRKEWFSIEPNEIVCSIKILKMIKIQVQ